ncbi:MAG: formylglycine-generating enzyme family protein [Nostoc sp. LLA-1]|nr:formylglycine-generating enzyme family protein [Cyanocohniella sp. LLY]
MMIEDEINSILDRVTRHQHTEADIVSLRQLLNDLAQLGKNIVNIGQVHGGEFQIGDRTYYGTDAETIKAAVREILPEIINSIGIEKSFPQNPQRDYKSNLSSQASSQNVLLINNLKTQLPPTTKTFEFAVLTIDAQGREKRTSKQAEYFIETLSNGIGLEMVYIPSGKFTMGASREEESSQEDERPQHIVNIKSFFIGRYPITQAQWRVVANIPQMNHYLEPEPSYFKGDNLPVERVSWYHAQEFCQRLSHETGRKYRLPTEAEWEYACRARTSTPFHFGKTITTNLVNYCAQSNNINDIYRQQTTEVGSFPANNFGLCDMHGLVWEWCEDYEHEDYIDAPSDGSGWINDGNEEYRILRGGSWDSSLNLCRSASRFSGNPSVPKKEVGFRVVFSET